MRLTTLFKIDSMRTKAIWVSVFMLAALLFLGKTSLNVAQAFQATKQIDQLNNGLRKQLILNRIANHLGYGGAIHQFKDYEIRRKDRYHAKALSELAAVKTLISTYRNIGAISTIENEQLQQLETLEDTMTSGLLPIKQMISERISSADIDSQVAIDFKPYRASLDTLFAQTKAHNATSLTLLSSAMPTLASQFATVEAGIRNMGLLYLNMGYGGVIHLFKNYLLHPDAFSETPEYQQQLAQISDNIAYLTQAAAQLPLANSEEESQAQLAHQEALTTLATLPTDYTKAQQRASDLFAAGKSLRSVVRKSKVKADRAYTQGLKVVNHALVQQFLHQQQQSYTYLAAVVSASQQQLVISIAVLLICILLAIFLFAIQMPRLMSKSIDAVAMVTGQQSAELHTLNRRRDEFGKLARAIAQSGEVLVEQEQHRQQQLEEERVQREHQQMQERAAQRNQLADDFEATLGAIISGIDEQVEFAKQQAVEVAQKSEQLMRESDGARQSSQQSVTLVESTEHASSALQEAIVNMGEKTNHASHIAGQAMDDTREINTMITRLDDVSHRVESVINSISNVAVNTRVLAMNATIEAASAGEAGKGFAVVAHEVKELAAESSQAVKNIAEEMAYMQKEISATATLLQNTSNKINSIHESTQTVAASVDAQVESIQIMAGDALAASGGMQDVISIMETLSTSADASEQASTKLHAAIKDVHARTRDAKVQLHHFLNNIRS